MAREHQRPERFDVARAQRVGERPHPDHLAHGVTAEGLVAHLVDRRVAQRAQPEAGRDGLAVGSALRVRTAFERAGTPECTTSTRIVPGSGSGSISSVRQSISNAWPARPNTDDN